MLRTVISEEDELRIDDEKFNNLINKDLRKIIQGIEEAGFDVRIVGGAVRDLLLGLSPRDIDLITNASPDETIYILSEMDLEVDVWGIKHGTVKAVIGDMKYEVTSLNFQIHKDKNGKLVIKSHGTWEDDAVRRDFTVNAMSMTLDGRVYDYAHGIKDLEQKIIRPLPDFEQKVEADPALIMRFFKMIAKFENPRFPKGTLSIIQKHLGSLSKLDEERILKEMLNIRQSPNAKQALELMDKTGATDILHAALKQQKK